MRLLIMFITAVCVLFLIKLRWPKNKSTGNVIPAKREDRKGTVRSELSEDTTEKYQMKMYGDNERRFSWGCVTYCNVFVQMEDIPLN